MDLHHLQHGGVALVAVHEVVPLAAVQQVTRLRSANLSERGKARTT